MPGVDDIDITTDLHSRGDGIPVDQGAVDVNRGVITPPSTDIPDDAEAPTPASLRDTLTDAFKGTKSPVVAEPATGEPAIPGTSAATDLMKVGDRWHRKDGSFASREEIDAFEAVQSGQPAPPVMPGWVSGLTELERQQFTALPAETKQWLERTMDGVMQRSAQYGEYDIIEQIIGPRRQPWADEGATPAVAIQQLLALSDFAGRDPGQFVMWFSDQHKLDLDALLDARDAAGASAPQSDPAFIGLQQEIAQLRNTINGFTTNTSMQQQAANVRLVQEFTDEKDAGGNLLRPYFNDVANDIVQHVAVIRQQQPYLPEREVLQAAYDFATFTNPAIRDRVQQDRLQATQNAAISEAQRARNAAVSINGGPAGDVSSSPNNANRTLRDELVHAYNQSTMQ